MTTDNCPECLSLRNPPLLVIPVGDGTEETYRCRRCGHQWWTGWGPITGECEEDEPWEEAS